jgi:hypothetical protein
MNLVRRLAVFFLATIALQLTFGVPFSIAEEESSNDEVLMRILEQARAFEKAYIGNYSRRRASARVLDGSDGELQSTRDIVLDVWDYHGEQPTNEVLECRIDDELVKSEKCVQKRRLEPTYRLFSDVGKEHYRYEYRGITPWKGEASHQIRVIPLEETTRHLKGDVYFLVDSLRFVGMHITLADYPFGLKDLEIELSFSDQEGLPVISGGESKVHIYVPFLINERTETVFSASEQLLLKERHTASTYPTGG